MRHSRSIGAFALLLTLASPVVAAQYVVDGASPAAKDANPGTTAQPFKTIQHAADVAQAGDTVLIKPGTYAESVHLRHSGTATKPIVFQSVAWHGATIVAPDDHTWTLFGPAQAPDGRVLANYVTVRGVVFGHAPFSGWGNTFTTSVGIGHGSRIEDCVVRDNEGLGFGNGKTFDCNEGTLLRTIFEGCYCGGIGGGGDGDADPVRNIHVIDCLFRRNNPKNLDPGGYNGANKFLFTKNLVMDGVISYDNNGSGSWFDTGAVDFVVKNCTFFGNHAGYALDLNGKPIGGDESDCGSGFMNEANQGPGLFEDNVFYSNLGDGLQDNDSGSKGAITIRRNLFVDNHVRGIVFRGMADMGADYGNVDRKTAANLIDFVPLGTGGKYGSWAGDDRAVAWSGGTPTPEAPHDHGYIWQNADFAAAPNVGWKLTVPADAATRTLAVYAGGNAVQTTLTAHLSDSSAPDYTTTQTYPGGGLNLITIAYHATGPGQTLTVTYVKSGNAGGRADGSADLVAVWLALGGNAGGGLAGSVTASAGPYNLSALGTLDWVHWGRVSYGGDRLLGAALVTHNVFKGNGQPWTTALEQHVLATPGAMGSVIDDNTYDIPEDNKASWAWWKPTDTDGIAATGLSEMREKLGVEAHGTARPVAFRGPLIPVHTYPTEADATHPDPKKLQEVPSEAAEANTIDRAIARQHGAPGRIVAIPVFGHTPISGGACQVYDLQARYVRLSLPGPKSVQSLSARVTPYAIIAPTTLKVRLTRVSPYEIDATLIP